MTDASIDALLTDPGFMADHYPAYARMWADGPVAWSGGHDGESPEPITREHHGSRR